MVASTDPSNYLRIITEEMARYGITDSAELICALLYMCKERHTTAIRSDAGKVFNDGFDGITGKHAISPADSLGNLAEAMARMHGQNAEHLSKHVLDANISLLEFLSLRLRCLASVLSDVIPGWEAEGHQVTSRDEKIPPHVSPRGGDSVHEPWEGRSVDFEGKPVDEPWDGLTIPSEESPEESADSWVTYWARW